MPRTTVQDVMTKVNDLEVSIVEALSEIKAQHNSHEAWLEDIKESVERVEHAIYGNGKPGLVEHVAVQNHKIKTIWGLVTAIGSALLLLVVEVITRLF